MSARGWSLARATLLAVAVALTAPVSALVLVAVAVAVQLLAFRRRDWVSLLLAAALLAAIFAGAGGSTDPLWYAERGWALLVTGAFVAATVLWDGVDTTTRGVAAVGVGVAAAVLVGAVRPGLLAELDWWVEQDLSSAALTAAEVLSRLGIEAGTGGAGYLQALDWQILLYPAFLALASVAALGIGRFVVERLSGTTSVPGPFREFRFDDQLVWVLLAGLLLAASPAGEHVVRLGENTVLFLGGLYLLRGIAVLFWVGAATVTSAWTAALWIVAGMLLYPVAVLTALALGLGDAWLDVRRRLATLIGG